LPGVETIGELSASSAGKPARYVTGCAMRDVPKRQIEIVRAFMDDDGVITVDVMPGM
jgi:hypothetical protein